MQYIPSILWIWPFVTLLLVIALFPFIPKINHWWDSNSSKLKIALVLSLITLIYYACRGYGFSEGGHTTIAGVSTAFDVLIISLKDFVPFIVLLFSLFVISGGIHIGGNLRATPLHNSLFLFVGAVLANIIGTTGASVLLIRPFLTTNQERKHKAHSVCFFIFLVSNIGGLLTPLGDPPLFLGYLKGVPFLWTLTNLWHIWLSVVAIVLAIYYVADSILYKKEERKDLERDLSQAVSLKITGCINFLLLFFVLICVALVSPNSELPILNITPFWGLREILLILLAVVSLKITPKEIHKQNHFNFTPIAEVVCLFIGIFITMQIPIEILRLVGPELGLNSPQQFFWASGLLSSFLDNAPTYVVFFETAGALPAGDLSVLSPVNTSTGMIPIAFLQAVSLGSVFMGANSYIGNGPNFMVKSIAESRGVNMPSFFGYIFMYSIPFLIPVFILLTFLFF